MAGNSHERGQSVVGRLLRILEVFSPERPELTIAEISRMTDLPPSTVYRLLTEMIGRGVVERVADGRYSVGLRLWEIGALAPRAARLTEVASPYLQDLYEATRGRLHLAVRVGTDALCVAAVYGHRCVEPAARTGMRAPLTSTSVGQVLLAYSPSHVAEQVLGKDDETVTNGSAASRTNGLRAVLAGIRRRGVAVARINCELLVAAPVFGPPGAVMAALALSEPHGDPRSRVPMLRMTTQRISRELLEADPAAAISDDPGPEVGLGRVPAVRHRRNGPAASDRAVPAESSLFTQ